MVRPDASCFTWRVAGEGGYVAGHQRVSQAEDTDYLLHESDPSQHHRVELIHGEACGTPIGLLYSTCIAGPWLVAFCHFVVGSVGNTFWVQDV